MVFSVGAMAGTGGPAEAMELPEFRVEGTPWQYARLGDMEILTRAPAHRTRAWVAGLVRGHRMFPKFMQQPTARPLRLILVEEHKRDIVGLKKTQVREADNRRWNDGYMEHSGIYDLADERTHVIATNLAEYPLDDSVFVARAIRILTGQQPPFPAWVLHGLAGECGPLNAVIGIPSSESVRISKLFWPDPAVKPGTYPPGAVEFPALGEMFDAARDPDAMTQAEKRKFLFQTGLFARWSLFGPVKNGRDRRGYWAFAEAARRGQATEALFRECFGMDWPGVCAELRRYLKSDGIGMLEVRLPHVMAGVPEAENLEFREATMDEVKRILSDFRRLREQAVAKSVSN